MALQLTRKGFPHTITIDDQSIRLHFKRMTVEQFAVFAAEFHAFNDARRGPDAVEPTARTLTPAQRADLEANLAWQRATFTGFVTVHAGDLEVDGNPVESGNDLFDAVGSYPAIQRDILVSLYFEQCLTESQKKTWRSLLAFKAGSDPASETATAGATPAPAAAAAESAISADSAAALPPSSTSSGTTDPSSSVPAPSGSSA